MLTLPRRLASAFSLGLIAALAVAPVAAADKYGGSKNFSPPASVPNYFSNESGPLLGGKADSRVVDPPSVSVVVPPPPQSQRAATTTSRAAVSRYPTRGHAARGHGRVHQASAHHGSSSGRLVAGRGGKARAHVAAARSAHATGKGSVKRRAS